MTIDGLDKEEEEGEGEGRTGLLLIEVQTERWRVERRYENIMNERRGGTFVFALVGRTEGEARRDEEEEDGSSNLEIVTERR